MQQMKQQIAEREQRMHEEEERKKVLLEHIKMKEETRKNQKIEAYKKKMRDDCKRAEELEN